MHAAGSLDRRIRVLQYVPGARNALGEPGAPEWPQIATLWASKRDISDAERTTAQGVGLTVSTRFVVRSSRVTRAIKAQDRIVHDDRTYDIVGIKEIGRRDAIEFTTATAEQVPQP